MGLAEAVQRLRLIDGRHPVGAALPGTVTLDEIAQRSEQDTHSLSRLSQDPDFPQPESDQGTALYSWPRVAAFLRDTGTPVPDTPQALLIADQTLRLTTTLTGTDIPPGTLRALGLPTT